MDINFWPKIKGFWLLGNGGLITRRCGRFRFGAQAGACTQRYASSVCSEALLQQQYTTDLILSCPPAGPTTGRTKPVLCCGAVGTEVGNSLVQY